ncbi:hypothetical protein HG531_012649 [Fusarium graminearum]|nr:hypothetical protein HG531_012649 [Fusarium graminearum]
MSHSITLIQVDLSQCLDRHSQPISHFFHIRLCDEHALRATKSTEGRIGHCVRLAQAPANVYIGYVVAPVNVGHGSFAYGCAEVESPSCIVEDIAIQSLEFTVLVHTNLVPAKERMSLATDNHVFLSS